MDRKIQQLSEHTINQIAAGEVIENPASVVKELVENALDAGATKIVVETAGGGLHRLKVVDNGCGMGQADAVVCLERHATSKITGAEDLVRVMTMGFRGEALASIASISKMRVQTSQGTGMGTEVLVEGGEILEVNPCGRTPGTTVEVKELFYNVPARRKFQKSAAACSAEVTKLIITLSLANPLVSFELYQEDQLVFKLLKEGEEFLAALSSRTKKALGESFLEGATVIDLAVPPFICRGLLGSWENTRPNRAAQYSFINERAISCPLLSYAVKDAFGTRIPEGRFPVFVLHLEMPSELVDVNVHPQKKEVRLQDERIIKTRIQTKLQEALLAKQGRADIHLAPLHAFVREPLFQEPSAFNYDAPRFARELPVFEMPELPLEKRPVAIGLYEHFLWVEGASLPLAELSTKGVVLVDLRSAGARVLFDSFLKGVKAADSQGLLFPLTLPCSIEEEERIERNLPELSFLGFSLEQGRRCYLVNAIPPTLEEGEALAFIRDFIWSEEPDGELELARQRKWAASAARLSSRRKRHTLTTAMALLHSLLNSSSPYSCPIGKKILVALEEKDLDQLFIKKH